MGQSGWFRFYHDLFRHPKFRRLSPDEKLVVIVAWCMSSRSPERGRLLIGRDLPATVDDIADEAKLPVEAVAQAIGTQVSPGLLCPHWLEWDGETLTVHDWDEAQYDYPSDRPKARAQKKKHVRSDGGAPVESVRSARGVTAETESDAEADSDRDDDVAAAGMRDGPEGPPGWDMLREYVRVERPGWLMGSDVEKRLLEAAGDYGSELVQLAVQRTVLGGGRAWTYTERILATWADQGIRTVDVARAEIASFQEARDQAVRRPEARPRRTVAAGATKQGSGENKQVFQEYLKRQGK